MNRKPFLILVLVCSIVALVGLPSPAQPAQAAPLAGVYSFSNTTLIDLPAGQPSTTSGPANPYPSAIVVSGIPVAEPVLDVNVTLTNLSHTFLDDIDILLEGPGGQRVALTSDACGSIDFVSATLVFDDAAAAPLPDLTDAVNCVGGTYQPFDYSTGDTYPAPAPGGPTDTVLAAYNGVDPNGTWNLYIVDDLGGDYGTIAGGWTLDITTQGLTYPNTGEILISVGAPVMSYGAAGNYPTGIVLPADYDGNGFDTYIITSSVVVAGETWYAIWIGGVDYLWVPASQVTILR